MAKCCRCAEALCCLAGIAILAKHCRCAEALLTEKEKSMDILERAEKAAERKQHGGYNCAQAVASVLADQTGLSEAELMKIASGFAVGMGNMEATCGALIGAVIAAGLSVEGKGTVRLAKRMSEEFVKKTGASLCKDIKGRDTKVVLCPCEDCVRNAVLIYGETVGIRE